MDRLEQRIEAWHDRLRRRGRLGPVVQVVGGVLRQWREDRVTGLAAEVAFWALLSLVPVMLVLAALLGSLEAIVGDELATRAEDALVDAMSGVLTDEAEGLVGSVEGLFARPSPGLLSVALVLTLWTASRGFAAVANALDVVYDLEEYRSWLKRRTLGVAMAAGSLVVLALLLAMVFVGPLLGGGQTVADDLGLGDLFVTLWTWARLPVVVIVLLAWATTVYHLAPNHRTPWRWDVPGALLAAVLGGLFTFGFRLYVETQGDNVVVSGLGGVLIAVLWLYLMALGLLLGGELNAVLGRRAGRDVGAGGEGEAPGAASTAG